MMVNNKPLSIYLSMLLTSTRRLIYTVLFYNCYER
jgi:hypothetical protein